MTERKRRSEDDRDMEDAQPPPALAKKRHTTKEDDFAASDFDESATGLDLDSIREFQKEAIWRQMREYKRDAERAFQRSSQLEKRHIQWEERIASVCTLWDHAARDIDTIVGNSTSSSSSSSTEPSGLATYEAWLEMLLPQRLPTANHEPRAADMDGDARSTADAQVGIERFNASVQGILRQLQAKGAQPQIDWQAAVDRITESRATQSSNDSLLSQVALLSRQLSDSRGMLEQRENELRRALKQLDRAACSTVNVPKPESQAPSDSSPSAVAATGEGQRPHESVPASPGLPAAVNGTGESAAAKLQAQREQADQKQLAEQRLAEIEEKVRENTELQTQVDSLKLQIAAVPDYIISETSLYKQTEASRDYFSAQAQRLQAEVERLFAEIGELRTSRTEFEEGVLAESTAQRQALEAEMQRIQNDLVRVRHHRDQVQRELEERRAQDSVEDQKSAELKLLSDVRRERMNALVSENKRLLAYVAVLKGDRAAFEAYTDEDLSRTTAVADELRTKLEQVARREKQLTEQLAALTVQGDGQDEARVTSPSQQSGVGSETSRLLSELQSAREEADQLQLRVRKYEEILGNSLLDGQGAIVEDAAAKSSELALKQKRVDELTLERDGLAKTSEMMERELQTICDSFAKLEEQNTSKVWDLAAKEQAIARVIAEKSKYEEKFIGLNKDREAQRMANQALRAQNAKQLEHIKAVEERDRALAQQLSLVGNEAQQATQAWQTTQTHLQEVQQRMQELEEQNKALEAKAGVTAAALNERTEALGHLEHEKRRVEESLELASRRISEAEKLTDQSGMAKLCADYKALLKCPTCQTNFKSHVLLRCMHVFCKQCIDSRIETRQRKCPSCSEPFGVKDVRQIYL
ncbi:E3 ubiquitin-protein ligase bre1 [Coemansia sp. RSA 552]|nr:E3 ubiquitin-protein ligase bre1 [Coemansia sp. RSA 552]